MVRRVDCMLQKYDKNTERAKKRQKNVELGVQFVIRRGQFVKKRHFNGYSFAFSA
jgi:hypothetical protein